MDYTENFQLVMLKQNLKLGLELKDELKKTINKSNNLKVLETFLQNQDFDTQLLSDQEMLESYAESDPELAKLIEQDIESIKSLQEVAKSRLQQLNGKEEKDKDLEPEAEEKETPKDNSNEGEIAAERNEVTVPDSTVEQAEDVGEKFQRLSPSKYAALSSDQKLAYNVQSMKSSQRIIASNLSTIKELLANNPTPEMIQFLSKSKPLLQQCNQISATIQSQPYTDEELKGLCAKTIQLSTELEQEIDTKLLDLLSKQQEEKSDEVEKLAGDKEKIEGENLGIDPKEGDIELVEGKEQKLETGSEPVKTAEVKDDFVVDVGGMQTEKRVEEKEISPETPKKAWELSPDQLSECREGQVSLGQEYTEKQNAPREESPTLEQDGMEIGE